jgi:hypothetical protein
MNRSFIAIAAASALIISGPAYAQRGNGGGKPTTSPSTLHGPSTQHGNSGATTHGSSGATTHGQSGATTHGSSGATTHGQSGATTHGQSGVHGASSKPSSSATTTHGKSGETHGGGSTNHSDTASTTTSKKSSTTPTSTTTSPTSSTTTLTPVQQKLQKNTNLADKLRTRLPGGTDLMQAAEGFKNLGQFVAAVNVSANHEGVTFADLKTRMVDQGMSLGQALQDVKKTSNVTAEVTKAEAEADAMIKSSTTTTTSTSTTSTSTTSTSTKKTKKPSGDK